MAYPANVLVADDEAGLRETLVGLLEDQGYRVTACASGAEAMKRLVTRTDEGPIDVVIADLKLPDMNGLDLLAAVGKINPDTAFILITGYATLETAIDAVNQGAFAYHAKP